MILKEVWPDDFIRYKRAQGWSQWAIDRMVRDIDDRRRGIRITEIEIMPDGRMNRENAAKYLGMSVVGLEGWATRARGPKYTLIARKAWYWKQDLDDWIKKQ